MKLISSYFSPSGLEELLSSLFEVSWVSWKTIILSPLGFSFLGWRNTIPSTYFADYKSNQTTREGSLTLSTNPLSARSPETFFHQAFLHAASSACVMLFPTSITALKGISSFNLTALGASTAWGVWGVGSLLGFWVGPQGPGWYLSWFILPDTGGYHRTLNQPRLWNNLHRELPEKDWKDFKLRNPQFYLNKTSDWFLL